MIRKWILGNASLLIQTDECNTGKHPLLANNLQDGGADSDTNSHCALILEETTPTSANHNCGNREKSNGNNNYEMREFNRRLWLSNGGSPGTGITAGGQSRRTWLWKWWRNTSNRLLYRSNRSAEITVYK